MIWRWPVAAAIVVLLSIDDTQAAPICDPPEVTGHCVARYHQHVAEDSIMDGVTLAHTGDIADRLAALGWTAQDLRRALRRLSGVDHQRTVYRWLWGPDHPHGLPAPPLLIATLETIRRLPARQRDALKAP